MLNMLRRKPSRIELNLDDLQEWHSATKEWEKLKKASEFISTKTVGLLASDTGPSKQSRREMIEQRIGYDPKPVRQPSQTSFS